MSKKNDKKKASEAEGDPAEDGVQAVRLSAHPRAMASIKRVRGWCGLIGFGLVTILALRSGLLLPDAVLRGLAGGAVAQFAGWFIAIRLWRQVALAELEAARERNEARVEEIKRKAAEEAAARLAADAAEHAAAVAEAEAAGDPETEAVW
jgi:hypothetical protein